MSVLTRGGDSDGSLPIIVKMTELVGQSLQLVRGKSALVEDDIVGHRSDRTLTDALRNQKEVVAETQQSLSLSPVFHHPAVAEAHRSLRVTTESTTVPGGGLRMFFPESSKNLVFTLFVTMIKVNFGW